MSLGINPLREERMLGNFNAINTKERASLPKKKVLHLIILLTISWELCSIFYPFFNASIDQFYFSAIHVYF